MVQRLFQLTFACRDVASDVSRGGVLSVDFSRVDVNEGGLHVPVVERQKSRFTGNGRVVVRAQTLGSAQRFTGRFELAQHALGSGQSQPRDVEFSVKRQGAVERRKRRLQKRSIRDPGPVPKTVSMGEMKAPFDGVKKGVIDSVGR